MLTATAERRSSGGGRAWLARTAPLLVVVVAAAGGGAHFLLLDEDAPEPLAVAATSVYDFATLDELVAASDVIVVGAVVAVDEGRLVGDPAAGAVVSRVATVRVESVLAGEAADGVIADVVIVEEEGWLPDGTPLIVNGWLRQPSVTKGSGSSTPPTTRSCPATS
jgi:hypothetical protein